MSRSEDPINCFMACEIDPPRMKLHQSGDLGSYLVRGYRENSAKQPPAAAAERAFRIHLSGLMPTRLENRKTWFGGIASPESHQN